MQRPRGQSRKTERNSADNRRQNAEVRTDLRAAQRLSAPVHFVQGGDLLPSLADPEGGSGRVRDQTHTHGDAGDRRRRQRRGNDPEGARRCRNIWRRGPAGRLRVRLQHWTVQVPAAPVAGARRLELFAHVQADPVQFLQEHLSLCDRTVVRHLLRLVRSDFVRKMVYWVVQRAVHGVAPVSHGVVRSRVQCSADDGQSTFVQTVAEWPTVQHQGVLDVDD